MNKAKLAEDSFADELYQYPPLDIHPVMFELETWQQSRSWERTEELPAEAESSASADSLAMPLALEQAV